MPGKIMPLCERDTSTIQAHADTFLSSPQDVKRNTRPWLCRLPGYRRLATDSDSSAVAHHARGDWRSVGSWLSTSCGNMVAIARSFILYTVYQVPR